MKLKAFKEKDKKKIGIILFTVVCILLITGVILYRTFAIFETNDHFNVINGNVQSMGDISFNFYINDVLVKDIPAKESGKIFDSYHSYCENGTNISWNAHSWEASLKNLKESPTKCHLKFIDGYEESLLNGAVPDLGNGKLIPVTISDHELPSNVTYTNTSVGGKVYKANLTDKKNPWYKYEEQKWANAVILKDGVEDHYGPNEEILESDIESYFVWIPRYRYQIWNEDVDNYDEVSDLGPIVDVTKDTRLNQQKEINIVFETNDVNPSKGNTKGTWLTHPAFTSFNVNGMWVGKFETGYDGATTTEEAQQNTKASDKIIIKPNVYSWRNIQPANAFYTSYDYLRELESHMMKNMEWGAVAYLIYSKYGLCIGSTCTEPRINNGYYVTGFSSSTEPTCGYTGTEEECKKRETVAKLNADGTYGWSYYNSQSKVASTTGNYSGIYDMSGGAWEYVMGMMQGTNDSSNAPASGQDKDNNSGFNGPYTDGSGNKTGDLEFPESKYYDLYDYSNNNRNYGKGHLGDATKELGPFYSVKHIDNTKATRYVSSYFADTSIFVNSANPWFVRGGSLTDGSETGVGAFGVMRGHATSSNSFRIVLMP